jgi:fructose-1,6-bisphosphatase/inositol monophosphatase family enzyme
VWLLDPLCGTLNFAAPLPVVGVNAALVENGEVVAAAAADPFSGDVFWTDGRSGRIRVGSKDSPLVPDAGSRLVDLNIAAAGCTVTDLDGDPVGSAANGAIVAADDHTHSMLLRLTHRQPA